MNIIGDTYQFSSFQTHSTKLDTLLKRIENHTEHSEKPVWIIDVTDVDTDINQFCASVDLIKQRSIGIWLRGYVRDLNPRAIPLFDALFLFDMSSAEFDLLRAAISLSDESIRSLRSSSQGLHDRHKMLVFLNQKRLGRLPFLEDNPILLNQIKEGPLDTTPLIPIIVEATKFLFSEAAQWLALVRKRMYPDQNAVRTPKQPDTPVSDAETEQPKVPTLTKEQFASLETNLDALKTTMDKVALEASVYRIKGLVEQIQIHRKNLTDLEKTEAEYGALVPQHIKRAIERESTGIIDKTLELQGLLSSVYQRKLEI